MRKAHGKVCKWCAAKAGTYNYPGDIPDDVYRRHENCHCLVDYDPDSGKRIQDAWTRSWTRADERDKIEERMKIGTDTEEMTRRKIGEQGQEIIDKPTYNKLTRDFLRRDGVIIRGEEAARHLKASGAYASYMAGENLAFIRDDATVSDVLEEMYHAEQNRKHMFGDIVDGRVQLLREIDAQEYLLTMAEKFKIPDTETNMTRELLDIYKLQLSELYGE